MWAHTLLCAAVLGAPANEEEPRSSASTSGTGGTKADAPSKHVAKTAKTAACGIFFAEPYPLQKPAKKDAAGGSSFPK